MNHRPIDKKQAKALREGDLEAFSELVREYSPRMLSLATGIVRRRETAEDVVQDALVKAYEKLHTWRGESSLATWLYRIVYTTAVSSVRARREFFPVERDGFSGANDSGFGELSRASSEPADDDRDWALTEENIGRMKVAMGLLPPSDRMIVELYYIEDQTVKDVAAICGLSESNVKVRLHRARVKLKKTMNDDGKR